MSPDGWEEGNAALAQEPHAPDHAEEEPPWERLDRDTVKASAILLLGAAFLAGVPTTIGVASATSIAVALAWVLPGAVLLVAGGSFADYLRWRKTRYRVTDHHVELRKGIVFVSRRRLGRDRIRAVDLASHPVLRWFGLVRLSVGTGEQGGGGSETQTLVLDPVPREIGEELQSRLLNRAAPGADGTEVGVERLATWRPGWTRYAPLSIVTPILGAAVIGAFFQVASWFGRGELPVSITRDLIERFGLVPVVAVGALVLAVGSVVLAVAFYLELWWRYRLEREPGGTLRVSRGLLTTRSVSLEPKRIRGVDLIEPLGVRLVGAARVQAVATGLGSQAENTAEISTLLPAAPRGLAVDVAERVGGQSPAVDLLGHPRAALARRLRWALMAVLALILAWAAVADLTGWSGGWNVLLAVVLTATTVALLARAGDSYRSLGHALTESHLIARRGSIRRSTVLLRRQGIIGWHVRRSIFQRRAGLATLVAITAAGRGHYPVPDAETHEILDVADDAVPDLMDEFLVRD